MPVNNIVIGQKISREMDKRARELRRNLTPAEKMLWRELRTNKFHGIHFRRQQIIERFIVDFYCHKFALIMEIDGGIHEIQREHDAERETYLKNRGLRILRFSNEDVINNLPAVLQKILDACNPSDSPFPPREGGWGDGSGEPP
jgi:very-short-patch-repair endonuclease